MGLGGLPLDVADIVGAAVAAAGVGDLLRRGTRPLSDDVEDEEEEEEEPAARAVVFPLLALFPLVEDCRDKEIFSLPFRSLPCNMNQYQYSVTSQNKQMLGGAIT